MVFQCAECSKPFPTLEEAGQCERAHRVRAISDEQGFALALLMSPDDPPTDMYEAAGEYALALRELQRRYPGRRFQFVPLEYMEDEFDRRYKILGVLISIPQD